MTFLLNWKYSPQFSATWDDSIGPQDFHAYSDPRSTQSVTSPKFLYVGIVVIVILNDNITYGKPVSSLWAPCSSIADALALIFFFSQDARLL